MPGWLMLSASGHIIRFSPGYRLLDATKPGMRYMILSAADVTDQSWEVLSPIQLQQRVEQLQQQG